MKYDQFSRFIVVFGTIIGVMFGVPLGLSIAPGDLTLTIAGTAIGSFIGMNIGLVILRAETTKRNLKRSKLFRMFEAASEVE